MKSRYLFLAAVLSTFSSPALATTSLPLVIDEQNGTVGPITAAITPYSPLLGSFPPVGEDEGEGFCYFVTHVFKHSDKAIDIFWRLQPPNADLEGSTPGRDDECDMKWPENAIAKPHHIKINQLHSKWSTKEGITVGTTLDELERIHGGPFTFISFGFEYGGTTLSDEHLFKQLSVRLEVTTPPEKLDKEAKQFLKQLEKVNQETKKGEITRSDSILPQMRKKLAIKVVEIEYYFPEK